MIVITNGLVTPGINVSNDGVILNVGHNSDYSASARNQ